MEVLTGHLIRALRHPNVDIPPLHTSLLVHPLTTPRAVAIKRRTEKFLPLRQDFADHIRRVVHNSHDPWIDHTFRSNHAQHAERAVVIAVSVRYKTTLADILERRFGADHDMHTRVFQTLIENTNQPLFLFEG